MAQDSHSRILHEGIINKKGQINKAWKERWFVLYNSRRLAYFESETSKSSAPIKAIDLSDVHSINIIPANKNAKSNNNNTNNNKKNKKNEFEESKLQRMETISVASVTDRPYSFELSTAKRRYLLSCSNETDFTQWIDHLEKSVFGGRLYQGWLIKRGAYRKSWRKRWFVIYDTQEMRYYDAASRVEPKGLIKLHEVLLMCPGDRDQYNQPYTIQLMTPDRNWVLATLSQAERDEWFGRLEETIHGAKRLITSYEGYLYKRGQVVKTWKKRYFALSKGWLFYFEEQFHCNKFKSIAFFSEAFFNQAFRLYVKGSIPLHQTTVQKVENKNKNKEVSQQNQNNSDIEKEFVFKIITEKREFQFATDTKNDLQKWFKAFHSTHNSGTIENDDESELTMTHDQEDDEYSELLDGLNKNNPVSDDEKENNNNNKDVIDGVDNNNNNNMNDDEKKGNESYDNNLKSPNNKHTHAHARTSSKTPLMDIIDPKGTAKWVDIEDKNVEQKQSKVLRKSLETTHENKK